MGFCSWGEHWLGKGCAVRGSYLGRGGHLCGVFWRRGDTCVEMRGGSEGGQCDGGVYRVPSREQLWDASLGLFGGGLLWGGL